jgi:sulfate permease, SulP family
MAHGVDSVRGHATGGRSRSTTISNAFRDLAAGVVVGVITVVLSISLGSLIFGGELAAFRAQGITVALLSTLLGGVVIALLSSLPGTIGHIQDTPAAVLAAVGASIALALGPAAERVEVLATVVVAIALATLTAGAVFLAVGLFRLGRLVRYLPYPVVGGFMAGTGWLLLVGGIGVMTGGGTGVAELAAPDAAPRWIVGVAVALAIVALTRVVRHPLTFPAAVAAATAAFYALVASSGDGLAAWRDAGYLLGPFEAGAPLPPLAATDLEHVHWPLVVAHAGGGATVVLIALMAGLLNTTGLELGLGRKVDLNRELRAAGLGNLLAGALGGAIVYQGLSLTMLAHRVGTGSRLVPMAAVGVTALTLLLGPGLLELVPTVVVGAVLAYLGLTFLDEWVLASARRLPWLEHAIVLTIAITIAAAGILTGVAVGLGLTVLLFVLTYASIDAVRHDLTGATARSRVRWEAHDRARLDRHAASVMVLQLHGFLFFGTANGLVERIERRIADGPSLRFLILDFRQVSGTDATSVASFIALGRLCEANAVEFVLADMKPALAAAMERTGALVGGRGRARVEPTLDAALEGCERAILSTDTTSVDPLLTLSERIDTLVGDDLELYDLMTHMERIEVPPGHRVVGPDDDGSALYVVASGQVTARLLGTDGAVRLETLRGGNIVGELGVAGASQATVVTTDEPTTLYRLDRAALERLSEQEPRLVAAVLRLVARRLAARVRHLEDLVAALQR